MPIPKRWEGCEHVVECVACNGNGHNEGRWLTDCALCGKRGVLWNGLTLPENMLIRGYFILDGKCWYKPYRSMYGGFQITEAQVCANIWELDGPVAKRTPAPLHLLDGVPTCTSN